MKTRRKAAKLDFYEFVALIKNLNYDSFYNDDTLTKDLSKVEFDLENLDISPTHSIGEEWSGIREEYVKGGTLYFLGCTAGGDWQYPIHFIVYPDQNKKRLRGYIPKEGNTWNYKTKTAFGDDDEEDMKFIRKAIKELPFESDCPIDYCDLLLDYNAMKRDIYNRLEVI